MKKQTIIFALSILCLGHAALAQTQYSQPTRFSIPAGFQDVSLASKTVKLQLQVNGLDEVKLQERIVSLAKEHRPNYQFHFPSGRFEDAQGKILYASIQTNWLDAFQVRSKLEMILKQYGQFGKIVIPNGKSRRIYEGIEDILERWEESRPKERRVYAEYMMETELQGGLRYRKIFIVCYDDIYNRYSTEQGLRQVKVRWVADYEHNYVVTALQTIHPLAESVTKLDFLEMLLASSLFPDDRVHFTHQNAVLDKIIAGLTQRHGAGSSEQERLLLNNEAKVLYYWQTGQSLALQRDYQIQGLCGGCKAPQEQKITNISRQDINASAIASGSVGATKSKPRRMEIIGAEPPAQQAAQRKPTQLRVGQ